MVMANRSFSQPVSFVAPREFDVGEQPGSVAVAEFNRHGVNDLAVVIATPPPAVSNVGVVILFGNGGGTFRLGATVPVGRLGFNTASLAVSDFNGDGIADWAVSVEGDNSVVVALGNGDGTFRPPRGFLVENDPGAEP